MLPMIPPTSTPAIIRVNEIAVLSRRVVMTATSIAKEASLFPFLAVTGEPNNFNPRIKRIVETI